MIISFSITLNGLQEDNRLWRNTIKCKFDNLFLLSLSRLIGFYISAIPKVYITYVETKYVPLFCLWKKSLCNGYKVGYIYKSLNINLQVINGCKIGYINILL